MCNTYLATNKKRKKFVQEQCNVCPLIVEDHLFLSIILDALCIYAKRHFKKPLA